MIILAQTTSAAPASSGGEWSATAIWVIVALWLIAWVILFVVCRIWEGRKVIGPMRLDPRTSVWPLAGAALAAIVTLFLAPNFYAAYRLSQRSAAVAPVAVPASAPASAPAAGPATRPGITFTPLENVALGAVEQVAAFLVMIGLHLLARPRNLGELGLLGGDDESFAHRIGKGLTGGLAGFVLMLPVILVVGYFVQAIYTRLHYVHPEAHELLLTLGGTRSLGLQVLIVVEAVIFAPIFEEFLFRGQIQTLVLRLLSWRHTAELRRRLSSPPGWIGGAFGTGIGGAPYSLPAAEGLPPVLSYAREVPGVKTGLRARWGAIAITALLFAMVHSGWERPEIFALALCLGYAYERTGNIWTNIMMHACFNGIMVLIFMTNA